MGKTNGKTKGSGRSGLFDCVQLADLLEADVIAANAVVLLYRDDTMSFLLEHLPKKFGLGGRVSGRIG